MRIRDNWIFAVLALVTVSPALSAPLPFQEELISVEIHGTVNTDGGEAVANAQLQLSFVKTLIGESEIPQQVDEMVADTTGEEGRYSIRINIDPAWSDFVLRLSASRLDRIRYQMPNEKQLTERIRSGITSGEFEFEVNWVVESRPRWSELRSAINRHGEESAKGRLLRDYGFPEREEEADWRGRKVTIWYYYAEGFAVRFIGGKQDKMWRFKAREYKPEERNED